MPCTSPRRGYRSREGRNPQTGKWPIVFSPTTGYIDMPVRTACGQCMQCRIKKSREWAVRMTHEASLYQHNCFITLTYADEYLPENASLVKEDHKNFMKRLRKKFSGLTFIKNHNGKYINPIRFFNAGEYGEKLGRPHFHTIIFNFTFPDMVYHTTINDNPLFTSQILQKLWPFGFSSVGAVTFNSVAYVARYANKKIIGKAAPDHYAIINPETGEIIGYKTPEFSTKSNRPGIGSYWLSEYKNDVWPHDYVIVKGKKHGVPNYYTLKLEQSDPTLFKFIKTKRSHNLAQSLIKKRKIDVDFDSQDRLDVIDKVTKAKYSLYQRKNL